MFHGCPLPRPCTPENADPYEPYGVGLTKRTAYDRGARPVLYLCSAEQRQLDVPEDELWRIVKLEVLKEGWVSWIHEREWRCPREFRLPSRFVGVIVRSLNEVVGLQQLLEGEEDFKPSSSASCPWK